MPDYYSNDERTAGLLNTMYDAGGDDDTPTPGDLYEPVEGHGDDEDDDGFEVQMVTAACIDGRHGDCSAWTRPYQLKSMPCDCACHTTTKR